MKIKIDPADRAMSLWVRKRDKRCRRCGKGGTGPEGIIGLQNSHYFGRANENTRFDPENCDSLCFGCHQIWGSNDREGYRAFKIKQLGKDGFNALQIRAHTFKKKDRKMALLMVNVMLTEQEMKKKGIRGKFLKDLPF